MNAGQIEKEMALLAWKSARMQQSGWWVIRLWLVQWSFSLHCLVLCIWADFELYGSGYTIGSSCWTVSPLRTHSFFYPQVWYRVNSQILLRWFKCIIDMLGVSEHFDLSNFCLLLTWRRVRVRVNVFVKRGKSRVCLCNKQGDWGINTRNASGDWETTSLFPTVFFPCRFTGRTHRSIWVENYFLLLICPRPRFWFHWTVVYHMLLRYMKPPFQDSEIWTSGLKFISLVTNLF